MDKHDLIKILASITNDNIMSLQLVKLCKDYLDRPEYPSQPITLEHWMQITRESNDTNSALNLDATQADNDKTFLFILRDLCVYSAGANDVIMLSLDAALNSSIRVNE